MKNNKGFTLVELLAIMVILAIIAVITVPIISKTLKDSRKSAAIDSSYGYVRAVDKLYYSKSLNDEDIVEDGIYTVSELKALGVSVDGREPLEGWVELEGSEVVAFSIKIGDYVVTKYRDSEIVCEKGEVQPDEVTSKKMEISAKVDSYVKAALAANSSLTSETALLVSEISGVTTNVADSGWIHFNVVNNSVVVVDYSLTYGDLTANYSSLTDGNYVSTFGSERNKPLSMTRGNKVGNVQYYIGQSGATSDNSDNIVYFDPINGIMNCATSDTYPASTNSASEYKGVETDNDMTSCLRWYIFSVDNKGTPTEEDDVVNMILDHNTTESVSWLAGNDYYTEPDTVSVSIIPTSDGYGIYGNNSKGPLTPLVGLYNDTIDWTSDKLISPSQYSVSNSDGDRGYTITYLTKARLISAEEIANIMGQSSWTISSSAIGGLPTYLTSSSSFWTSTLYSGDTYSAWRVYADGGYLSYAGCKSPNIGVRPVITVLLSDILE